MPESLDQYLAPFREMPYTNQLGAAIIGAAPLTKQLVGVLLATLKERTGRIH
jgi:hypothetical protein